MSLCPGLHCLCCPRRRLVTHLPFWVFLSASRARPFPLPVLSWSVVPNLRPLPNCCYRRAVTGGPPPHSRLRNPLCAHDCPHPPLASACLLSRRWLLKLGRLQNKYTCPVYCGSLGQPYRMPGTGGLNHGNLRPLVLEAGSSGSECPCSWFLRRVSPEPITLGVKASAYEFEGTPSSP